MILLVDNYDSFSYNVYQLIGSINTDIKVIRNDEMTVGGILELSPSHIIISPGPGRPRDAGICEELIKAAAGKIPILGICLGHQAICEAFGARITYAKRLMHGKKSAVSYYSGSPIFADLDDGYEPAQIEVARYHSLAASDDGFPDCLQVTARTDDGEIMSVRHKDFPIFGLQFHPESILTQHGKKMMENFLKIK